MKILLKTQAGADFLQKKGDLSDIPLYKSEKEIIQLMTKANRAYSAGDFYTARDILLEVLKTEHDNPYAIEKYIKTQTALRRVDLAEAAHGDALARGLDNIFIDNAMLDCYVKAYQRGERVRSDETGKDGEGHYFTVAEEFHKNLGAKANSYSHHCMMDACATAVQRDPSRKALHVAQAEDLFFKTQENEGERVSPSHLLSVYSVASLGETDSRNEYLQKAKAFYRKHVKHNHVKSAYIMAQIYYDAARYQDALSHIESLSDDLKRETSVLIKRFETLRMLDFRFQVLEEIGIFLNGVPEDFQNKDYCNILGIQAFCLKDIDRPQEAFVVFSRLLEHMPAKDWNYPYIICGAVMTAGEGDIPADKARVYRHLLDNYLATNKVRQEEQNNIRMALHALASL